MKKDRNSRINFLTPLHLATSNDDFRTAMQCIAFDNGYAVATDGHILIRQSFALFEDYSRLENLEFLNGKYLHRNAFARIYKEHRIEIQEKGILAQDKSGNKYFYPYSSGPLPENFLGESIIYPKYEVVLTQAIERCKNESINYNKFGINANILHRLSQVMYFNGSEGSMVLKLPSPLPTQAILVESSSISIAMQAAIIMPLMVIN